MGNKNSQPAEGGEAASAPEPAAAPAPSWYAQAQAGYNQVVDAIIRPPRAEYTDYDLGPPSFQFREKSFIRQDLELVNGRGLKLQCSWWKREGMEEVVPAVVALHGNSSCRLCALECMEAVLTEGCSLFSFDFAGSGQSEGDYVSLGFFEKDDLAVVVDYLRGSEEVSTVGLWGRSMGAATALLHGHRDPTIAAMVLDSPFSSLRTLATELVDQGKQASGYSVPGFVVSMVLGWVQSSVKKKAKFDINDLTPIADVDKSFIPALFVAGKSDDFIQPSHSQAVHDKYAGDKNLSLVTGNHNSPRPDWWLKSASVFLQTYMQIPPHLSLIAPSSASIPAGFVGRGDSIPASWARARAASGEQASAPAPPLGQAEDDMIRRAMAVSLMVGGGGISPAGGATATAAAAAHSGPDAASGASKDCAPAEATLPPPAPPSSGGDTSIEPPSLHSEMMHAQVGMSEVEMLALALAQSVEEGV